MAAESGMIGMFFCLGIIVGFGEKIRLGFQKMYEAVFCTPTVADAQGNVQTVKY